MTARRRAHLVLLAALATLLGVGGLLWGPGDAVHAQACPVTTLLPGDDCPEQSTTSASEPTTTTEAPTTIAEQPPTSVEEDTSTTQRRSATTESFEEEEPVATIESFEEETSTTLDGGPLLVPGPTNGATGEVDPAALTTTASTVPAQAASATDNDNTGTVVFLVISGLLVVALLLSLLTVRYWRVTKPVVVTHHKESPATAAPLDEVLAGR